MPVYPSLEFKGVGVGETATTMVHAELLSVLLIFKQWSQNQN